MFIVVTSLTLHERAMFQQLANAVSLPHTDPLKLEPASLIPLLATTTDTKTRPNSKTHPRVRFWIQDDFLEWLDKAAEAELDSRGKVAYLEDENGKPVLESTVKGARKVVRSGFCELTNRGLAPKSWGKLCTTGRHIFHTIVENAHPFFKLANDGWKLDHLAGTSYPAWRRTHLDDEGNWKSKKGSDESDEENSDSHKGKKRRLSSSLVKPEVADKKIKGIFSSQFRITINTILQLISEARRLQVPHPSISSPCRRFQ